MNLAPVSETLAVNEKHDWLASKHGLDSPRSIMLDGTALAAVYTAGLAKSGTILALNTSTGRYVPYDQATSANGLNVPAGILYTSVAVKDGAGTAFNTPAAMLLHCQVITSKLPRSSAQTGGPHADAVTALSGRIIFRTA